MPQKRFLKATAVGLCAQLWNDGHKDHLFQQVNLKLMGSEMHALLIDIEKYAPNGQIFYFSIAKKKLLSKKHAYINLTF